MSNSPKIKVIGIGNSGINAINSMIASNLKYVEFVVMDSDSQAVAKSKASTKIQLKKSIEESLDSIKEALIGSNLVFIVCGFGGKTGTNVAPIVSKTAKDMGILTIAIITTPYRYEKRIEVALNGVEKIKKYADASIIISCDKTHEVIEAYRPAPFNVPNYILYECVQSISDIIHVDNLVPVDFKEIKTVLQSSSSAQIGIGKSSGEGRATEAAELAIDSKLLEYSINDAKNIIVNITGDSKMTSSEIEEVVNVIRNAIADNTKVIFGAVIDEEHQGEIVVSIITSI